MSRVRDVYAWVEEWAWPIIEEGEVSATAALVLLRLGAHGDAAGMARPSARTLARQVGRSERTVRQALESLRDLGYIAGEPQPARVTNWRLVTDESERHRLRELRTRAPQSDDGTDSLTAEDASAVGQQSTADQLRTNCELTANQLRTRPAMKVKAKMKETPSPSPQFASRDVAREKEEQPSSSEQQNRLLRFDPRNLVALRSVS